MPQCVIASVLTQWCQRPLHKRCRKAPVTISSSFRFVRLHKLRSGIAMCQSDFLSGDYV